LVIENTSFKNQLRQFFEILRNFLPI